MTSSLVGSEMCIRDRPSGRPYPRVGRRCACTVPSRDGGGEVGRQKKRNCLLYTSDAADDM
eukprot:3476173-Prorocentrum_lima.AAC.1